MFFYEFTKSPLQRYISDLRLEGALRVTEVDLDEIRTFALSQISGGKKLSDYL